jgi:hypothetical protein
MNLPDHDPLKKQLQKIREQIERMETITRNLTEITRYETIDYLNGKIIDIQKASGCY